MYAIRSYYDLQVVFDLQAVGKHAEAYVLLESLYSLVDQPQQQREILFWMADSKAALGEHEAAAELYLRSANHPPGEGKDIWGQSVITSYSIHYTKLYD